MSTATATHHFASCYTNGGESLVIVDANSDNRDVIATMEFTGDDAFDDQQDARATLMAAAPQLLEACDALVGAWERGERMHYGDPQAYNDPIGKARLAIRAAFGC